MIRQERQRGTTKERMQEVLLALNVSATEFENNCGIGHGFVARVSRVINKSTRIKIKLAYPKLNIEYIATGVGDIFVKEGETYDTIKDRLKSFLEQMNVGRKDFSERTGISEALLSNMTDNLRSTSLEKIYRAFPMLNPEWLEYGDGDMIIEKEETASEDTAPNRVRKLIDFLGITTQAFRSEVDVRAFSDNVTKRTIDKIVKRYPFVNPLWLMHGTGEMYYGKPAIADLAYAPLVTKDDYPNYFANLTEKGYIESLQKVPYIQGQEIAGNIMAFEIIGEKMNDGTVNAYVDGDIVLCRELSVPSLCNESLPREFKDYVIVREDGIHIRQILNHNIERANITVHCTNSYYPDEELGLNDVKKLFVIIERRRIITNK